MGFFIAPGEKTFRRGIPPCAAVGAQSNEKCLPECPENAVFRPATDGCGKMKSRMGGVPGPVAGILRAQGRTPAPGRGGKSPSEPVCLMPGFPGNESNAGGRRMSIENAARQTGDWNEKQTGWRIRVGCWYTQSTGTASGAGRRGSPPEPARRPNLLPETKKRRRKTDEY